MSESKGHSYNAEKAMEEYVALPLFSIGNSSLSEADLRGYLQTVAKQIVGGNGMIIPQDQTWEYLSKIERRLHVYRGTQYGSNIAAGMDYTLYPSVALQYARADYSGPHSMPVVQVCAINDVLKYAKKAWDFQNKRGFVPSFANIIGARDLARKGSLQVLFRSPEIEFPNKTYRTK